VLLLELLAPVALATLASTNELAWPDYRGPTRDGHAAAARLPLEWSEKKNVRWKSEITGVGWSSPIVGEGRIWITTATEDGKLMGTEPDFDAPSRGSLCVKGQFASWEFVKSDERLKYPLIRENDAFRRASWDEALDLVASRLSGIRDETGPDSIVCWSSARTVTEANYLMQKFTRIGIGTNNIDNCSRT